MPFSAVHTNTGCCLRTETHSGKAGKLFQQPYPEGGRDTVRLRIFAPWYVIASSLQVVFFKLQQTGKLPMIVNLGYNAY
jgi:hypothetical protein